MKIQQQQNAYNPNMKALYFTKARPIRSEAVKYTNQKITETGIKYVEDISAKLTPIMKEAFEENRFIKNLAEKFDVFIQYSGERFNFSDFSSSADVHVVRQEKDWFLLDSYLFNAQDRYSPEGARYKLLAKISNGECIDNKPNTHTLGK